MTAAQGDSAPEKSEVDWTFGEERVRYDFNPDQSIVVDQIKGQTAALIDLLQELKDEHALDARLVALAQTAYEQASMWAVKAATS